MLHHREGQVAAAACPSCYLEEVAMAIINLRRYYPHYPKDKFLEVPDEVADTLEEGRRMEHRQDNRRSYYHVYSIDCTPAIENHAMFLVLSPEELLIQNEDEAAVELVLANLAAAMTLLSPTQARRLHARYALKKKFREIAADIRIFFLCCPKITFPKMQTAFFQLGVKSQSPPGYIRPGGDFYFAGSLSPLLLMLRLFSVLQWCW